MTVLWLLPLLSLLLLHCARQVVGSLPWLDPTETRCWDIGEVKTLYIPCTTNGHVTLTWTRIETDLTINRDLEFEVELNSPLTQEVAVEFHACRAASYDCNPVRVGSNLKSFRLTPLNLGQAYTNGSRVAATIQTPYAERHTFVFVARINSMVYHLGVIRDVMSGQAVERNLVTEARCQFQLPTPTQDLVNLDLSITKNDQDMETGLQFEFTNAGDIPDGKSYQMHVHDTGDMRGFANALGHFLGASLDKQRRYEAGMLQNTSFRVVTAIQPFNDTVVAFTGINSILDRSIILHDGTTGARVAQCLIRAHSIIIDSNLPAFAAIPDFDASVCVFDNGDVVQMEVQDALAQQPRILVRYSFQDIQPVNDSAFSSLIHNDEATQGRTLILDNLPVGAQSGKVVLQPSDGKNWYTFRLGSNLKLDDGTSCVIARADRSGVFYPREFTETPFNVMNAPMVHATTSASCVFNNFDENVAGQVVFTRVSGDSAFCDTPQIKYDNCVRMDYVISGLPGSTAALSIRQFGLNDEDNAPVNDQFPPLFNGLRIPPSQDCTANPLCALGVVPPESIYPITAKIPGSKSASGVLFSPFLTLNGLNSLVGRAMYLHSTASVNSSAIAKCTIGIEAISLIGVTPGSLHEADNPDRAVCVFAPTDQVEGSIWFQNMPGTGAIKAVVTLFLSGEDLYSENVFFDFDPLLSTPSQPTGLRTSVPVDNTGFVLNRTIIQVGNITLVSKLFGYTIALYSDIELKKLTTCIVGLAQPTIIPTLEPTFAPTSTEAPTIPGMKTKSPTLRPPPTGASGSQMSLGSIFVLAVLLVVIVAFFCLVCVGIRRRFFRARDQYGEGAGIGDGWNYQVEMTEMDRAPLKPVKPSAAKFSSLLPDDDDFNEHVDEEELTSATATASATSSSASSKKKPVRSGE